MFDLDGTLKGMADSVRAGKPGLVLQECLCHLEELKNTGWRVCVVTNQAKKGHVVARVGSFVLDYEAFPGCFEKRGIPVFGSGFNWPVPGKRLKDKENFEGVGEVAVWVDKLHKSGYRLAGMNMYMVGDRLTDGNFFDRLVTEVTGLGVNLSKAMFYKVPGSFDNIDKKAVSGSFRLLANVVP